MSKIFYGSTAMAQAVLNQAASMGLDVTEIGRRAGLSGTIRQTRKDQVAGWQFGRLWAACAELGAGADFGCQLGNCLSTASLKGLNILLDTAPCLRESLMCLPQGCLRVTNSLKMTVEDDGRTMVLSIHSGSRRYPHHYLLDAVTLALIDNYSSRLQVSKPELICGISLLDEQYCYDVLKAEGVNVRRGTVLSIAFDKAWAKTPLLGANEFLFQSLRRQWVGNAEDDVPPVPAHLELARYQLLSTDQPLEHIARQAGYRQANNFIRAFRRQFGVTPNRLRKQGVSSDACDR